MRKRQFPSQQAAIDSHRETLAATKAVVAEWAAKHGGTRDPVAASILELLADCAHDTNGDATLESVSSIFEEHGEMLPTLLIQQLAHLADAAHGIGRYRGVLHVQ